MFHMPLREIEERFTRSELTILAWRSQEQHFHFMEDMPDSGKKKKGKKGKRAMYGPNDIGPEGMPDEFFAQTNIYECRVCHKINGEKFHCNPKISGKLVAEEGEIYLAQVKGEEARRYFESRLGIPMPPGVSKFRDESDASREIRQAYGIKP